MFASKSSAAALVVMSTFVLHLVAAEPVSRDLRNDPMPSAGLAILPEPKLRLTAPNQADYDYGRVSFLDTAQIEHTFTLRNDGPEPVTITQLQPSCHCTLISVEKIADRKPTAAESTNPTLLPGLEMSLKISVQLPRQPPGPLTQGVYIYALGYGSPIARLYIQADLAPALSIHPSVLDFGSVKLGETKTQTITITFDARVAPDGNLPPIEIQTDAREETNSSSITISPAPEPTAADFAHAAPGTRLKTLLVTFRPEHVGDIVARLSFTAPTASTYNGPIPYDRAVDVFRNATVPLFAHAVPK